MNVSLKKAVEVIKGGGILIFPTDTAFGIGCRIDNETAVKRLFEIRKRPKDKAVPVLFDSIGTVRKYVLPFDKNVQSLMKKHWPGALTIVLKCRTNRIPSLVRGGGDSLGVRIPNHELVLELIQNVGVPIIGTSANVAGGPTPFSLDELDKNLMNQADGVLTGKTKGKSVSTVIDCTTTSWKILRQGGVSIYYEQTNN